jgi:hypothetical protein
MRTLGSRLRWALRLHQTCGSGLPHRLFQTYNSNSPKHLQSAWLGNHFLFDPQPKFSQTCARVLLSESARRMYLKRFRKPNLENIQRISLCKAVNAQARKVVYCPYCSSTNGAVKKAATLKIIHDKFRAKKTADEMEKWKKSFAPAVDTQQELGVYVNKAVHEQLNPLKVLHLFKKISDEVRI